MFIRPNIGWNYPPCLGISSGITLKVLRTLSVLAGKQLHQGQPGCWPYKSFSIGSGPCLGCRASCQKLPVVLSHKKYYI